MKIEKDFNNGVGPGNEGASAQPGNNPSKIEKFPIQRQVSASDSSGSPYIGVDNYYKLMSDDVYEVHGTRLEKVITDLFKDFEFKKPRIGSKLIGLVGLVSAVPTSDSGSQIFGFIPASEWRGVILVAMLIYIFFIGRGLWDLNKMRSMAGPKSIEEAVLWIKKTFQGR